MNKSEYFKFHRAFTQRMSEITRAKNADYTGGSASPFANFTRVEALGVCSTEQGFLTRMTDKLSRLSSYVSQGTLEVKDESVKDTLMDLANYCVLMAGYLESKQPEPLIIIDDVEIGEMRPGTVMWVPPPRPAFVSTAQAAAEARAR